MTLVSGGARRQLHNNELVSVINSQWLHGGPSDDLTQAGLLVHTADGSGIWMTGFLREAGGRPPPGDRMWQMLGTPDATLRIGDRRSASIINNVSRAIYEPGNVRHLVQSGFGHLPFVVFDSSATAVQSRISCCYSFDVGSTKLVCPVQGGGAHGAGECTPGCDSSNGTCERLPLRTRDSVVSAEALAARWQT